MLSDSILLSATLPEKIASVENFHPLAANSAHCCVELGAHLSRAADRVALGCATLAPRLNFSTLRYSEEIFLLLVLYPTLLTCIEL